MARNGVVFVLLLSFNVMYGLIIHTEPDNLQVAVTENVVHVTGSILSSNLDKLRGHVLKKLRAGLEVSPDFLTNSNLSATINMVSSIWLSGLLGLATDSSETVGQCNEIIS